MIGRTWREGRAANAEHDHYEHDETRVIDTGHGVVELSIFEDGQPPASGWRREPAICRTPPR